MPIYEYACEKCNHEFEREQSISDAPAKTCPKCRSRRVKRLISQTSFVLKGGGWYKDLYSSSKAEAKADKKPSSKPATESKTSGGDKGDKSSTLSKPSGKASKKSAA